MTTRILLSSVPTWEIERRVTPRTAKRKTAMAPVRLLGNPGSGLNETGDELLVTLQIAFYGYGGGKN